MQTGEACLARQLLTYKHTSKEEINYKLMEQLPSGSTPGIPNMTMTKPLGGAGMPPACKDAALLAVGSVAKAGALELVSRQPRKLHIGLCPVVAAMHGTVRRHDTASTHCMGMLQSEGVTAPIARIAARHFFSCNRAQCGAPFLQLRVSHVWHLVSVNFR